MTRWGDYGISKATYSGPLLEQLEVRADPGGRLGDVERWTRERVVAALVLGLRLVTMREVPAGGWARVADVGLVEVDGGLYVRVDGESVGRDDLGVD